MKIYTRKRNYKIGSSNFEKEPKELLGKKNSVDRFTRTITHKENV